MTQLMEQAIDALRHVPSEHQDEIARLVLELAAQPSGIYELSAEEDADLARSEAEAARGEFASDAEVQAVWAKHGL